MSFFGAIAWSAADLAGQSAPSAPAGVQVLESEPLPSDPLPDPSWVQIDPGTTIQDIVNKYAGATTFYLRTGTHRRQRIVPKSGNTFVGAAGAVLDGENVTPYAFETLSSAPTGVKITNLEIKNYATPDGQGAIQGDNGSNWTVENSVIHDNAYIGVRAGKATVVRRNKIYRNGKIGISGYKADGLLIVDNEVYENNAAQALETAIAAEASGIKVVCTANLTVRNNYVHDNYAKGIWGDTNYPTTLIEGNTVVDNKGPGIWHEVGYAAVIRYNSVERNGGTAAPAWMERAGIQVSNSPDVQIYGNTVLDNINGIGVMQASGYATSGPYGAYGVQNLSVHDNVVRMMVGRTGLAQNVSDTSYYTSRNNHFEQNIYTLGPNSAYFFWNNQNSTESQWKAYGNDDAGTFNRVNGS